MKSTLAYPYAYVNVIKNNFDKEQKNRSNGQKKRYNKPILIKLVKKVTFNGLDGITFHPGTLMRVIRNANRRVTYAIPLTENAKSRVPLRYKAHLEHGFSLNANEWEFVK